MEQREEQGRLGTFGVFPCQICRARKLPVLLQDGLVAQLRLEPRSPRPNKSQALFFPRPRDTAYPTQKKPLPQEGPGSATRLLGGALAMVLILSMTLAVFLLYRWQQKSQLGIDISGMDLSPSQKLEPTLDRESQLAPEDIQGLHLELGRQQEDLPLQPPYYDLGVSPTYQPLSSCLIDSDVHYAELDTSALEHMPGSQTTVPGPGEAVEYATIQLSPP